MKRFINYTMKKFIHTKHTTPLQSLLLMALIAITNLTASGQADQRIAMADKYFAAGEYYTAAGLYEQYLNPVKKEIPKANFPLNTRRFGQGGSGVDISKFEILYKQAESYRLANYWKEAIEKYKTCYDKNSEKYANAVYWIAVCQRSIGKYTEAESQLKTFLGKNSSGDYKQKAETELETIRFIKKQLSRPDTILFSVNKIETSFSHEKGIFAMNNINGNNFIYTSTVTNGFNADGNNPNQSRLFYSNYRNGVLENSEPLAFTGADASYNQGAASISADKKTIYFTQWKKVDGKNISAIYSSTKEEQGWGKPVLLSSINMKGSSSKQPFCSADGKTLFFASDRPGGKGGFDIWYVQLQPDGTTGTPENAGGINTSGDEQAPFYHNGTGNLVFSSNGRPGMGGYDLFIANMKGSSFETQNMGYPVNSSRDDIYFYAPQDKGILENAIIGSDRGSECCMETYTVSKAPKKRKITGIVVDCKTNEPVANAEVIMKDAAGNSIKSTSGTEGKFAFDLAGEISQQSFIINKEEYIQKTADATVETINNADMLIDIYNNIPLCIEKIVIEEKKLVIKAENVVTVYFDFDKSLLKERGITQLDSIVNVLTENSTATIQISGYTDGLGTVEYNNKLSDRRSKACADYLIKKGVDASRVSFVSFGKCCPVEMELINGRDNPDGRSKNRRALINISKDE